MVIDRIVESRNVGRVLVEITLVAVNGYELVILEPVHRRLMQALRYLGLVRHPESLSCEATGLLFLTTWFLCCDGFDWTTALWNPSERLFARSVRAV